MRVSDYILGRVEGEGFFVDIGAYDGVTNDETLQLEAVGWKGICIEGNPDIYEHLKKNRKITHNAFVGERNKEEEVLMMSPAFMGSGLISNWPENHFLNLKDMNRGAVQRTVKTEHLEDILDLYNAPRIITLLKSDTEGNCLNILKTLSYDKYKFLYITCELGNDSDGGLSRGKEFLKSVGYEYLDSFGQNDIFRLTS